MKDMTKGNITKQIILFAIPLLIGNLFQQIYTMVDTMIAGHFLGATAIAAIGAAGALYGLIINLAWGLNSGFSVVITRYFGNKDIKHIQKSIAVTIVLDISFTILMTIIAILFLKPFLHLLNTPQSIFNDTYKYIFIIFLGMIGTIIYDMFSGIMRSFGNSKIPMYVLIFASFLNIGLDILFIKSFKMGVEGTAFATIISQIISGFICGLYVLKKYKMYMPKKEDWKLDSSLMKEMLLTGGAMSLMYSIVNVGSVIFQSAINTLGEVVIAAHTASEKIISILMGPTASIMDSSSTFVGQNYGAKRFDRIQISLKKSMKIEVVWGIIATIFVYLFGNMIIRLITGTTDTTILNNATLNLKTVLPFFPVLGVLLVQRTAMQAIGQKIEPVISSFIEVGMRIVGAIIMVPSLGYIGVCWNTPITWSTMTIYIILIYYFKTKKKLKEGRL